MKKFFNKKRKSHGIYEFQDYIRLFVIILKKIYFHFLSSKTTKKFSTRKISIFVPHPSPNSGYSGQNIHTFEKRFGSAREKGKMPALRS